MRVDASTATVLLAQKLYGAANYRDAADALVELSKSNELARRLYLDSLVQVKDRPALISHFNPPRSEIEAIHVMDALWSENQRDSLKALLQLSLVTGTTDSALIEMRNKYAPRLRS